MIDPPKGSVVIRIRDVMAASAMAAAQNVISLAELSPVFISERHHQKEHGGGYESQGNISRCCQDILVSFVRPVQKKRHNKTSLSAGEVIGRQSSSVLILQSRHIVQWCYSE